jgi:hypothetical protein
MPLYNDPSGEKSVRLTNRLSPTSWLASHILSFLSLGKYKIMTSNAWRAKKIVREALKAKEAGISDSLEAIFKTGETGRGMRKSIRLALENNFKVSLFTGPPYCDAIDEIKEFLKNDRYKFELYVDMKGRPEKHFVIIANKHAFLEVPHEPFQVKRYSVGINNAKHELIDSYTREIDKMKEELQKVTTVEEFNGIIDRCLITPTSQKGKPWWQFWKKTITI